MKNRDEQIAEISIKLLKLELGTVISPVDLSECTVHQLNGMVDAFVEGVKE